MPSSFVFVALSEYKMNKKYSGLIESDGFTSMFLNTSESKINFNSLSAQALEKTSVLIHGSTLTCKKPSREALTYLKTEVNNITCPLHVLIASCYVSVQWLKGHGHVNCDWLPELFLFFSVLVFLSAKYDTFTTNCGLHCTAMTALWHYKLHPEIQFLTSAKETCNNSRKFFGYTQGHTQTKKTHYWRCRGEWQLWVADKTQSNYAPVFDVALLGEMQNYKSEFGQRSLSKF